MDSQLLGTRPSPVDRAAMVHWWDQLTFLHWRYRHHEIQRLLPPGLEVEECDGSAWVGLVPFFLRVGLPRVRPAPWLSQFAETNVRTYVRNADGQRGVWFFSLDAARLGAVVVARSTYRLPYFWSRIRLDHTGGRFEYECRRRWPGPRGARPMAAPPSARRPRPRRTRGRCGAASAHRGARRPLLGVRRGPYRLASPARSAVRLPKHPSRSIRSSAAAC